MYSNSVSCLLSSFAGLIPDSKVTPPISCLPVAPPVRRVWTQCSFWENSLTELLLILRFGVRIVSTFSLRNEERTIMTLIDLSLTYSDHLHWTGRRTECYGEKSPAGTSLFWQRTLSAHRSPPELCKFSSARNGWSQESAFPSWALPRLKPAPPSCSLLDAEGTLRPWLAPMISEFLNWISLHHYLNFILPFTSMFHHGKGQVGIFICVDFLMDSRAYFFSPSASKL